jgi:hypothetical protein
MGQDNTGFVDAGTRALIIIEMIGGVPTEVTDDFDRRLESLIAAFVAETGVSVKRIATGHTTPPNE